MVALIVLTCAGAGSQRISFYELFPALPKTLDTLTSACPADTALALLQSKCASGDD